MALHQIENIPTDVMQVGNILSPQAGTLASTKQSKLAKRLFDIAVALSALLFLAPVLVLAAIAVKLTSRGPVLFKQSRTGLNGQTFMIFKFRSMKLHDDADARQATQHDDRITAVGRFLRKSSIDELPQLLNVLFGNMSIVGPRPHARAHDIHYSAIIPNYAGRFAVLPGITGLAQVNNLRGETETVDKMAARVALDVQYAQNASLWNDIKILVQTPFALLDTSRAY